MRRRYVIAAAVGVALSSVGALVAWPAQDPGTAAGPALTPLVPRPSQPPETQMPGSHGNQDGSLEPAPSAEPVLPEVAAVRMLELTEDAVGLSPGEAAALQRSISTERSADRLAADVGDLITELRAEVPDGVLAHVAPIGVSSRETALGWEVSVWYVEVLVYGDVLAVEQWRTAIYSLQLEDGEWKMDALRSKDGPTPTRLAGAVPTPVDAFRDLTTGFDDGVLAP